MKYCELCSKDYVPTGHNQKYCSKKCFNKTRTSIIQKWREKNYMGINRSTWGSAKARAKQKGLDFSLIYEEIKTPEYCPILGIKLNLDKGRGKGYHDDAPSLDRIDNSKGYTPDNTWVISQKANVMKSSASVAELKKFAEWINTL